VTPPVWRLAELLKASGIRLPLAEAAPGASAHRLPLAEAAPGASALSRSLRTRSSTGGCVENNRATAPAERGLTMNRCAVAGLASGKEWTRDARSSFSRALASPKGPPASRAPVSSAPYSRVREMASRQSIPSWLEADREGLRVKLVSLPKREELVTPPLNEQFIVELYSK